VFLGFLKGYPSNMIGDVSCGTGFAGIFATSTLLTCKALGISNEALFLVEAPTILLYFFAFKWLSDQKKLYPLVPEENEAIKDTETSTDNMLNKTADPEEDEEVSGNEKINC
jgi:hypothetical protein